MHPLAQKELGLLPTQEKAAVDNAMKKLEALGPELGYPYSSAVQAADAVRELRPRAGSSPRSTDESVTCFWSVQSVRKRKSIHGSSTRQYAQQKNESTKLRRRNREALRHDTPR